MTTLTIPRHLPPDPHGREHRASSMAARRIAWDCGRPTSWVTDLTADTITLDLPGVAREAVEAAAAKWLPADIEYSVGEAS